MNKKICIIDYKSGNQKSLFNIIHHMGYNVIISQDPKIIDKSTHIILPGVGAYGKLMQKLIDKKLIEIINEQILFKKKPFLGICVGMQILSDKGFEFGEYEGLKLISGTVNKMHLDLKLPHIGWNTVKVIKNDLITKNIDGLDFYFLHSFFFKNKFDENILTLTKYGIEFPSIIKKENIYGFQFHPEKSQENGRIILKNFFENIV